MKKTTMIDEAVINYEHKLAGDNVILVSERKHTQRIEVLDRYE